MSMHNWANAGPNRAALAAFIEPGDGGTVFEKIAPVAAPEPKRPQPIAYCTAEGGLYRRWPSHNAAFVVVFDDGSVFDMQQGWRSKKLVPADVMAAVEQNEAEERKLQQAVSDNKARAYDDYQRMVAQQLSAKDAGLARHIDKLYNDCLRQMVDSVAMQSRPQALNPYGVQALNGVLSYGSSGTAQSQNVLQDAANKDRETVDFSGDGALSVYAVPPVDFPERERD